MLRKFLHRLGLTVLVLGMGMLLSSSHGYASGGGSGGSSVDTIKVTKCEYAVTQGYVELLISASSSNSNAQLYAFLPFGQLLGEVHSGGRYGGTVFLTFSVPETITIISTYGGSTTVPCVPFQP